MIELKHKLHAKQQIQNILFPPFIPHSFYPPKCGHKFIPYDIPSSPQILHFRVPSHHNRCILDFAHTSTASHDTNRDQSNHHHILSVQRVSTPQFISHQISHRVS